MIKNAFSWVQNNFTYHGRISRGPYIAVTLSYWAASSLLYLILKYSPQYRFADWIYESFGPFPAVIDGLISILFFAGALIFILFYVIIVIFSLFQTIRRLHDINTTGWFWPIKFISLNVPVGFGTFPIQLGVLMDLVLFVWDGTPGPNRFGEDPKKRTAECTDGASCDDKPENVNENMDENASESVTENIDENIDEKIDENTVEIVTENAAENMTESVIENRIEHEIRDEFSEENNDKNSAGEFSNK